MRGPALIGVAVLTVAMTAAAGAALAAPGPASPPVPVSGPTAPAVPGTAPGVTPVPLPAHSQRPVCGPPAAGAAACHAHVVTRPDSAVPLATTSYASGLRPDDLQAAYALPSVSGQPGTGPTVAIVDAYDNPNAEADLNAYRAQFNLGTCTTATGCFKKVNQNGGTKPPRGNLDWGAEIDIDVQMVSAVCPTCKILLVEASSNGFRDLMKAVDYATAHADFVSNSYGASEFSSETAYDFHFNKPGVAITVSSGDDGYGVSYPAASPFVTAVGGTSLSGSISNGWSETAWSGAGSGCSVLEAKPAWQHDQACARRTVTDVSAVADPNTGVAVYDSYGSMGGANWYVYGGTSVAAPLIAGIWALAGAPSGTAVTNLYAADATAWHDVVGGSNADECTSYLCAAQEGYDGPTGWGTPNGIAGFANPSSEATPPPPSAELTLTARGYKVKGVDTVELGWNGASAVTVFRDGSMIGTTSLSPYTDSTGVRGGATFSYKVCATTVTLNCSNEVAVTF